VLAEVAELLGRKEGGGRRRDDDLAAARRGGDAGGAVDVRSDVALLGEERRSGVQAAANLDRAGRERLGEGRGGGERPRGGRKGEEEGVALRVDLHPALSSAGLADDPAVLGERLGVTLLPELVEEPRRALDVGEAEGDGAGGEVGPHCGIIRRNPPALKRGAAGERRDRGSNGALTVSLYRLRPCVPRASC
jgi:hypothetical protein